jgi:hypothetical protein
MVQESRPRSRRDVLAAACGGAVALIGSRLAGPTAAAAADGQPMLLGTSNNASRGTSVSTTAADGLGGVTQSTTGAGVYGRARSTTGVTRGGDFSVSSPAGIGVLGEGYGYGTGVHGHSGYAQRGTSPGKVGVYATAWDDASFVAMLGETKAGLGVKAKATTGTGLYGTSDSGYGLVAFSGTGTAAVFSTSSPAVGTALMTSGRVRFEKSVGLATVARGTRSVVVTPGIDVTATAAVVATLQGSAGGAVVERVSVDATNNRFTIYLTKNTTANANVAWHIFG